MIKFSIWKLLLIHGLFLVSCTKNENTSKPITGGINIVPDSVIPGITPDIAEKKITEIQEQINSDPLYVLQIEDLLVLKEEGLAEESDLKAWVK